MKQILKSWIIASGILKHIQNITPQSVAVLRYHSVLDRPTDFEKSIGTGIIHSSDQFNAQMELLARKYNPVSLDDVLSFLEGGRKLPPRAVAVTFDDGFVDNYEIAKPILDHYGIPAAFYIAVSSIESPFPPWYIRLRHAFYTSTESSWFDQVCKKKYLLTDGFTRNDALVRACQQCAPLAGRAQDLAVAELETQLQVEAYKPDPGLMLTWDQIRRIQSAGHIIGSHTLTHPNMAYVADLDILKHEMISSKEQIERHIGAPVIHFSYPSPMLEPHWSDHTIDVCKMAGYLTATTCTSGKVVQGDNPLAIKRMWVPDTLQEFEWCLSWTLLGRTL